MMVVCFVSCFLSSFFVGVGWGAVLVILITSDDFRPFVLRGNHATTDIKTI